MLKFIDMTKNIKKDFKENSQRLSFSKAFKRRVLLEYSKGKNSDEILNEIIKYSNTTDKKYASKIVHKWRKEMYLDKEILYLTNHADIESIEYDIISMTPESDNDDILEEFFE